MSNTFLGRAASFLKRQVRAVRMARRGNMAIIFALAIIPVLVTGGAGIDLARSLSVRAKLYSAVDAAALAVASKSGITQTQANTLAQQYFNANFTLNSSFGTPNPISVVISGQQVTVSSNIAMPTTIMGVVGIHNVNLTASSQVVWGQTKIWVGLALDNTGSMCEPFSSPCTNPSGSKINALKTATHSLLTLLQNASTTAGDVQVSLVPFSRDVNVGTSNVSATWLDWSEWDETNGSCSISGYTTKTTCLGSGGGTCSLGSGSAYDTQSECTTQGTCSVAGFNGTQSMCQNAGSCSVSGNTTQSSCTSAGTCSNGTDTTQSSCTAFRCSISGYNSQSSCQAAYTLSCTNPGITPQSTCTANKACSKAGYSTQTSCQNAGGVWAKGTWTVKTYGVWSKGVWTAGVWTSTPGTWTAGVWTAATWTPNHSVWNGSSGWNGCITDRGDWNAPSNPPYDTVNTAPGTSAPSKFPTEYYNACPVQMIGLAYDWTALNNKVDAMVAQGNTNQTIGLAWAWHSLSQGAPLSPPSLPTGTTRHIILLSDGENTQNRWYTDRQSIDDRMHLLCNNAKADGVVIWTVFVNIAGGGGNAASMQDCATGGANGGHYIEATSTGGIGAAFDVIGQQITNLRVAH